MSRSVNSSTDTSDAPPVGSIWNTWHHNLLPLVHNNEHHVVAVQQLFGMTSPNPKTGEKGSPSSSLLVHNIMVFASSLGNEAWYASWATIMGLFFDRSVSFSIFLLWAAVMYLGQFLKDSLRLPRPGLRAGSHVLRLETQYAAEFGFPSTHAMGAASQPLALLLLLWSEGYVSDSAPLTAALVAFCLFWFFVTPISRLYMGVHSSLDVAAGLFFGVISALLLLPLRHALSSLLSGPYGVAVLVALAAAALAIYPRPKDRWTNSPGDTAIVVFTAAGALSGFALVPEAPTFLAAAPALATSAAAGVASAAAAGVAGVASALDSVSVARYLRLTLPSGHWLLRAAGRFVANVVVMYSLRLLLKVPVRVIAGGVYKACAGVGAAASSATATVAATGSDNASTTPTVAGATSETDSAKCALSTVADADSDADTGVGATDTSSTNDTVSHVRARGAAPTATAAKGVSKGATEGIRTPSPVPVSPSSSGATAAAAPAPAAISKPSSAVAAEEVSLLRRRYFIEIVDKATCYYLMGLCSVVLFPQWLDAAGLAYLLPPLPLPLPTAAAAAAAAAVVGA